MKSPDASHDRGVILRLLFIPFFIVLAVAAPAQDLPAVEAAIPPAIQAAGAPQPRIFPGGVRMAISTHSPDVQALVNQGLNHLHGGWEFEAARHFAAAMREDPDCLMAHWGMVMALLTPNPESAEARAAATARMLSLVEAGKGTDLERGYAYGLVKYLEEGPSGAAVAFRKVADKYPKEMQAAVFSALFQRGGYDELGSATPDQEAAEDVLLSLCKDNPQSALLIHALLMISAEAPDLSASLDLARQLCQLVPDYPPYQHLLGHYEWRCGHHHEAAAAFAQSSAQYQLWMKNNGIALADCGEWIQAECYRVVAIASQGDTQTAIAEATQLANTLIPGDRAASPGARALWWDAHTLIARIGHTQHTAASLDMALQSLPAPEAVQSSRAHTLAHWWINGLRIALHGMRCVKSGDLAQARDVSQALTLHGENMARMQDAATAQGERTFWLRAFRALEVLASDLRGEMAMAGPRGRREIAYNWFASAADRQAPEPMLMPPMVLTSMPTKLGWFHLKAGRHAEAIEAFERALQRTPRDRNSLDGLLKARDALHTARSGTATQPPADAAPTPGP